MDFTLYKIKLLYYYYIIIIRQMSQSQSMDRVWMEDVFKFDSFRFRAAHHHFGLFCQQEKENSPAVCIGLTPGGARRLHGFGRNFVFFFFF